MAYLRQRILGIKKCWFSINGRIHICLFVCIFGMMGITAFSFISSWVQAYAEVYGFFQDAEEEMSARIDEFLDGYENTARRIGYSSAVQRYLLSDNPETVIFSYSAAYGYITDVFLTAPACKNIFLYADNRRYLCANRSYIEDIRKMMEENNLVLNPMVRKPFFVSHTGTGDPLLLFVFPVYSILSVSRSNRAICILVCDMKNSTDIYASRGGNPKEDAVILRFNQKVISSSRELTKQEQSALGDIVQGRNRAMIGHEKYLTAKISLPEQLWDFIYITSESAILNRAFSLINKSLLALCVVIILAVVILMFILRSVNSGIFRIVEDLSALEYTKEVRFHSKGRQLLEIEKISHSVNLMLKRLNSSFRREQMSRQKLFDAITAQTQAEFKSYRSQINPHFLFNTLECMRSMAHNRKDEDLETMISSMSQMFRYSLNAQVMVPLNQELAQVRNFIQVMNIRFGGRYRLKTLVDEEIGERRVLSMILEPLIENAVYHGFNNSEKKGNTIVVQAFCRGEGGPLVVRVTDNGDGISPDKLEVLEQRVYADGTGAENRGALRNIYRRMKLSYGEGFSMKIYSKEGYYTTVELTFNGNPEFIPGETKRRRLNVSRNSGG